MNITENNDLHFNVDPKQASFLDEAVSDQIDKLYEALEDCIAHEHYTRATEIISRLHVLKFFHKHLFDYAVENEDLPFPEVL